MVFLELSFLARLHNSEGFPENKNVLGVLVGKIRVLVDDRKDHPNRILQLPLPLWRARAALDVRAMVRCGLVRVERKTTLPSETRHESLSLVPRLECNQGHCGPKLALWHCNRLAEENVEISSHFLCGLVVDIAPVLQKVLDLGDLLEHPTNHILALCWGKPRRKTTEENLERALVLLLLPVVRRHPVELALDLKNTVINCT